MEEELSKSILYNLNILKHAVPCSKQVEEALVEGLFIKSNTTNFVHITHYLFSIIDSKEFKKRFYWPIVDKRGENAYRTSSVDFFNMLIEKYNLTCEHVKQVNVVHPSGKKFMVLILLTIQVAMKEVMARKYKCADYERSLDINEALSVAKKVTEVETELQRMLNEDVKVVKERSHEIQEILSQIVGRDELADYELFVSKWLEFLKEQAKAIEERNVKINNVVRKAREMFEKAQEMMSKKEFKITVTSETFSTSMSSLVENMKKTLPVIKNFITSYPLADAAVTQDEKKIVKQKLKDLEQMDKIIKTLGEKCKTLHTTCSKLQAMNEACELLDNDTLSGDNDNWKMSAFVETSHSFDASKNCVSNVDLKGSSHIALLDENDNLLRANYHNRTVQMNAERTFKAPIKLLAPPTRRKRRDPMELLDKATSSANSKNQSFMQMNSSMMSFKRLPTSTPLPLSSTMLMPDAYGNNNMMFNFSTVSEISVMSQPRSSVENRKENYLDVKTALQIQNSSEKTAMEEITNIMPKITISDATAEDEKTLTERENFGSELCSVMERKSIADEDLFNISDSCLVQPDD